MMKRVLFIIWAITSLMAAAESAYACDCMKVARTAWGELQMSDAVFTGEVTETKAVEVWAPGGRIYFEQQAKLKVQRWLKGSEAAEVTVRTDYLSSCGSGLKQGEKYLVYARMYMGELRAGGACTRTKPLQDAAVDFKEIEAGVEIEAGEYSLGTSLN